MPRDDLIEGFGKLELLKHALADVWPRRIDDVNRMVYISEDRGVTILQSKYQY
ncbi:type II toxin-antitoxin system YoeB family toxin [Glutamicibacter soli]|uniref:type II toxin-antitoxin system YoeB family toxin n=1 Tax=Glutamicibacter soli TaxID=453836 RepID=UPI003FD5D4BC